MRNQRGRLMSGFAGLALIVTVGSAEAQMKVSPWVGLYAPTNDLGTVQAVDFGKKHTTLAYGADLDFKAGSVLGFRIGGGYASDSDVGIDGVGCTSCSGRATVLTGTGSIVLRPIPLPLLRPYAVIGAGWKWYNFDFDDQITSSLVKDQAKFTWQAGIGATLFPTSGLSLFAEVSDFVSEFDFNNTGGNTQHDLVFKAGVSLGGS